MSRQDDDDEYREFIKSKLRDLDGLVSKLPRGSLSAGQTVFDPTDPNTWHAPDAPDSYRRDAVSLYGITPDKVSDGLSQREKRELHQAGTRTIGGISHDQFRASKRLEARYAKASGRLWNTIRVARTVLKQEAADPDAVKRAAMRLMQKSGITDMVEVVDALERHPDTLAVAINNEMANDTGNPLRSDQADTRTAMITDSGGGGGQGPSDDEAPQGDGLDELRHWQRTTGFHR